MKQNLNSSSVKSDLIFLASSAFLLMALQTLLRGLLLWRNQELAAVIPDSVMFNAFLIGLRFDLLMTAYAMIPLVFSLLHPRGLNYKLAALWLTLIASVFIFLAVLELDFYYEFHVRLNSLVFQYLKEDPATVMSMIWYGFPVVRYLILIAVITAILYGLFMMVIRWLPRQGRTHYLLRLTSFFLLVIVVAVSARGTLRHGPPLRWGDAFQSDYLFANHLGLNGSFTFSKAFIANLNKDKKNRWLKLMPEDEALLETQASLLITGEKLLKPDSSAVLRQYNAGQGLSDKPLNVVFILMESFSGEFTGSLGHDYDITPNFDRLSKQGLLFSNFVSNGTHTHQGMFASIACFPNIPGYSALMQTPEGDTKFSGILDMLNQRNYQSMYIYNGDFAWDNQNGFFGGQGMQRFIGRHDFVDPKFSDPTWGVSDEDMFNRAAQELAKQPTDKPFFAFLQTLSNHTPYALPEQLPVDDVTDMGGLNEHLTAMRYADWALGEFFDKVEKMDFYQNTIFVLVGDHGFGTNEQLTDIDLLRFHVPLLIIGPNVTEQYGFHNNTVGSQVDIAPTIAGLLGGSFIHSCWGRDLLNVDDAGFAMIKSSGSDVTTALLQGDSILIQHPGVKDKLYNYELAEQNSVQAIDDKEKHEHMKLKINAYIQSAMKALLYGQLGTHDSQE